MTADHGLVKIDGELWTARSFDGDETYAPGDRVRQGQVIVTPGEQITETTALMLRSYDRSQQLREERRHPSETLLDGQLLQQSLPIRGLLDRCGL